MHFFVLFHSKLRFASNIYECNSFFSYFLLLLILKVATVECFFEMSETSVFKQHLMSENGSLQRFDSIVVLFFCYFNMLSLFAALSVFSFRIISFPYSF